MEEKKDVKEKDEVAKWDETDPDIFKPSQPTKLITATESKPEETAEKKTASDISFGGKPSFMGTGGAPKFSGTKNKKIVNKEEFPGLGEELTAKMNEGPDGTKSSGPPKFDGNSQNMFSGLEDTVQRTVTEENRSKNKGFDRDQMKPKGGFERDTERPRKEYKEKDEFFGNFRSANKDIKPKEPEAKSEPTFGSSSDGPPKFAFKNNKKDAMTMAKAQELALKEKEKQDALLKEEEKKKKHAPKPKSFQKDSGFEKKRPAESTEKPKAKKAKEPKAKLEKAEIGDSEWGNGNLEDMLK